MDKKKEEEAAFFCGLLNSVLYQELDKSKLNEELSEIAKLEVTFPNGKKKRPSLSTLKRKYKKYTEQGFNALARKGRSDAGKPRAVSPEVIETVLEAKRDQPRRSALMINQITSERHGVEVARSTMYRHLKDAGVTRAKLGIGTQKVRKRWTCQYTHDMWVGDFEHGPFVLMEDGSARRSYLSAFIDVCSRSIVAARYYVKENFDVLSDTLILGFQAHGLPRKLYVDNAKVYHARPLQNMCYRLAVDLKFRPVRDPAAGGLVERFFHTAQSQFEAEVLAGPALTLPRLNECFAAWLNVVYEQTVNSDTGQTPAERYQEKKLATREVDMGAITESFEIELTRVVNKTFSDISLHGSLFQVDPKLRGDRVLVRYDLRGDIDEVSIYSQRGVYLGKGRLHYREEGQPLPENPGQSAPRINLLEIMVQKHKASIAGKAADMDYSIADEPRGWSFTAFAGALAELTGRSGGLTAFTPEETDLLQKAHARLPHITRTLLKKACAKAQSSAIPAIIYHLQQKES